MSFQYDRKSRRATDVDRNIWVSLFGGRDAGDMREGRFGIGNYAMPIYYFSFNSPVQRKKIDGSFYESIHISRIIIHLNKMFSDHFSDVFERNFGILPGSVDVERLYDNLKEGFRAAMREDGRFDSYIHEFVVEFMDQRKAVEYMKSIQNKKK